jgi:tetratricopeptide (TPR) repeat protein
MMNEKAKFKKKQYRTVNQLIWDEEWEKAQVLALTLLEDEPENHWLLAELAETYYEQRNYEKALGYIEQALKIAPHCPLVLWHYSLILYMLKRYEDAIRIYKGLIRRGIQNLAYEECGEGIRWARILVNNCRYFVGLAYARTGNFQTAKKYIEAHIANRNRNCPSIYSLRDVRKDLSLIKEGKEPL